VLIATLVTFGLLSRANEVTAAKSLGVSLFRLGGPALVAAAAVSLLSVFLQAQVLPATNDKAAQLRDRIYGKPVARTYRRADRQWLFGQGRYIYNYRLYDERTQSLQRLQVFEFDDEARLTRRLFAASAQYRDGRWVFTDTWTRSFRGAEVIDYQRLPGPTVVDYPETPAYFQAEIERPAQMSFGELRDYAAELRAAGQPLAELDVQVQARIAFPFVAVVMCLVALPFAFRLGKHGALYGLGLAVVLGIAYLVVYAFFKTLGETGALPAAVAVWAPSLLFALFAGYLFLGVRS
jgi:lipopolysaccharide export system permease protein